MLNTLLFSFFFGMPPIVAIIISRDFESPLAHAIHFWGGLVCAVLAGLFLAPLYVCDGDLLSGYEACGVSGGIFEGDTSWLSAIASLYVLGGPAAALIGYLAELRAKRRVSRP